jgi:AcrR family transcriptional regulator
VTSDTPTLTEATPATPVAEGIEPAPRRQRADARRNRDAVLAAAHAAFAEHGPEASLDDVARRAGVGIGTVYRNFPTRQALLEAVMGDRLEGLRRQGEELLRSSSPGAALTEFLRAQLEHSGDCRGLAASVMISALDRGEGEPTYCEALQQTGAALLARAQDAGEIRRDTDIDDLVRMVNAIGMATEESPERADRLFALMMDGLRVEDS